MLISSKQTLPNIVSLKPGMLTLLIDTKIMMLTSMSQKKDTLNFWHQSVTPFPAQQYSLEFLSTNPYLQALEKDYFATLHIHNWINIHSSGKRNDHKGNKGPLHTIELI